MNSWLFQFASANPITTVFLAFPICTLLIGVAWQVSVMFASGASLILQMYSLSVNAAVILIRGYAPNAIEPEPDDDNPEMDH